MEGQRFSAGMGSLLASYAVRFAQTGQADYSNLVSPAESEQHRKYFHMIQPNNSERS